MKTSDLGPVEDLATAPPELLAAERLRRDLESGEGHADLVVVVTFLAHLADRHQGFFGRAVRDGVVNHKQELYSGAKTGSRVAPGFLARAAWALSAITEGIGRAHRDLDGKSVKAVWPFVDEEEGSLAGALLRLIEEEDVPFAALAELELRRAAIEKRFEAKGEAGTP